MVSAQSDTDAMDQSQTMDQSTDGGALAIALAATFTTASLAYAGSVTIKQTDPTPTNSIVIKEKQDPDLIIKKKKKVVSKDNDPDVTIKSRINID